MYKNLEIINKNEHINDSIKDIESFEFAKEQSVCIVTLEEYFQACKDFPIFFTKDNDNNWTSVVLLGTQNGKNLFVTEDNKWDNRSYIPAFFRRFPFIFVVNENNELALGVDKDYKIASKDDDKRKLFTQDGEHSDFLEDTLKFMNHYHMDSLRTTNFIKELESLELLVQKNFQVKNKDGKIVNINDFYIVNEEKLHHLSEKKKEKICKSGLSNFITAHLISITNVFKLAVL